jgi:hypothetical protein
MHKEPSVAADDHSIIVAKQATDGSIGTARPLRGLRGDGADAVRRCEKGAALPSPNVWGVWDPAATHPY